MSLICGCTATRTSQTISFLEKLDLLIMLVDIQMKIQELILILEKSSKSVPELKARSLRFFPLSS